jgi:tetratricopeptide (TPR) repeat protein
MRFRSRCIVASCAIWLGSSGLAWAKERPPNAEQVRDAADAFDRGRAAFRAKGYVEAAEYFEAADGYVPSAQSMLLAIRSRLQAGQTARALTLAELALRTYDDNEDIQKEARKVIEAHSSSLGRVNASCEEACELILDGKLVHGRPDTQRTLYMDPGLHKVRASWPDGRAKSLGVRIEAGQYELMEFVQPPEGSKDATDAWLNSKDEDGAHLEAAPEAPKVTKEAGRSGWSPAVFWTGVAVTGVGVGVSTFLGINAISNPGADQVRDACRGQGTECEEYQQGLRNQTAASVAIGVTAGLGVLTAVTGIFLTDWGKKESHEKASSNAKGGRTLHPILGFGNGFELGARGTF